MDLKWSIFVYFHLLTAQKIERFMHNTYINRFETKFILSMRVLGECTILLHSHHALITWTILKRIEQFKLHEFGTAVNLKTNRIISQKRTPR